MSDSLSSAAKPDRQRKLRNYWLNPRYQIKYIFWLTFTGLLLISLQTTVFYLFVRENYSILVDLSPMDDSVKQQLYKELYQILALIGLGSLLFLAIVGVIGLVFSHRTVGPLYHFKRVFEEVTAGDRATRIRLRPKDDFQEVAAAFNRMMDSLQDKK